MALNQYAWCPSDTEADMEGGYHGTVRGSSTGPGECPGMDPPHSFGRSHAGWHLELGLLVSTLRDIFYGLGYKVCGAWRWQP